MNTQERTGKEPKDTTTWTVSDLPQLSEYDRAASLSYDNRRWALDFVSPEKLGMLKPMTEQGVMIQNAGGYVVRCIYAVDHYEVRISLAMLVSTFNAIGVTFELGECTVVVPYVGDEDATDEDKTEQEGIAPGPEVV